MKSIKLLLFTLLIILCSSFVLATITHSGLVPANLFQTTGTSVVFNWTATTTGSVTVIPSYLLITEYGNESNFLQNQSIKYVTNGSNYNTTVNGFIRPGYYQYKIRSGDAATKPVMTSSNSYPYNTSDGNNTLNFNYTINGTFQQCTVNLTLSAVLNASDVVTNFGLSGCNFTVTNTSFIILTGTGYGTDEYIQSDGGNASTKIGFSGKQSGTQTNFTSVPRYFEIQQTGISGNLTYFRWMNDSGFEAMRLNKDTGDLVVAGGINASSLNLTGNLDITGNITLGQKITFFLGAMIDNIVGEVLKFTGHVNVTGDLYVTENARFAKNVSFNTINSSLVPSINNTYDLGASGNYWQNIYVGIINLITLLTDDQISNDVTANATKLIEKQSLNFTHFHAAENITNGTFGAGNVIFPDNVSASYFLGDTITPTSTNDLVNKEYVDLATASTAFDFFLTNQVSDLSTHYNLTEADTGLPETSLTTPSMGEGNFNIFNWTTKLNQPEFNELRQGIYDVHIHLSKSGSRAVTITPYLYNVSADGTVKDLIVTFETSEELTTSGIAYELHGVLSSPYRLVDGSRLLLEINATFGAGSPTSVTVAMEGTTDSHLTVETSSNAFEKIFVRRDGTNPLLGDWDQGVFNLTNPDSYFLGRTDLNRAIGNITESQIYNYAANSTADFSAAGFGADNHLHNASNITSGIFLGNYTFNEHLNATNWLNVTITESQIKNYAANSSSDMLPIIDAQGFYNESKINTTQLQEQTDGFLGIIWSWLLARINEAVIPESQISDYGANSTADFPTFGTDGHLHNASNITSGIFLGNYTFAEHLNATNWQNVTIAESQIKNYACNSTADFSSAFADITGDTWEGDMDYDGFNITNINTILGKLDNIRIGNAGHDSNSLISEDDLYVSGKLEVDGLIYSDAGIDANTNDITSIQNATFSGDPTNHRIRDNSTCLIFEGDTTTFLVC